MKRGKQNPKPEVIYNVPLGTDEIVHIRDILIPSDFKKCKPRIHKIKKVIRYFGTNTMIDKPISVIAETNEKGIKAELVLIDEYSRYVAALEWLGLKFVPVKYIDINEVYIGQ